MDILSKLSESLNYLMDEREISTSELSAATGIDQSAIARFLRGERLPALKSLVALADYFKCTTDCLLGKEEFSQAKSFSPCPPFAERLEFLLKSSGVTKYRLEKDTGISGLTITAWQRGVYQPNVDNLIKLAKFFDCSVDYILGRT